jgi:hypothetical protein
MPASCHPSRTWATQEKTWKSSSHMWKASVYDTIQERSDSDFVVKFPTVQFSSFKHNWKSNCWIELNVYLKIPEVLVYVGVKFQMNQSLGMTCDIGQNMLYKFCYLLCFNLWTSYLASIIFQQGCESLFW